MAEFCTCGSIVVGGHCTNKNCALKSNNKPATAKSASGKAEKAPKKEAKSTRTKRASKCIVYNLYDKKEEENV